MVVPRVLVIMGVSGSGKTTVGSLLAAASAPDVVKQFETGFGDTLASVGILLGLGTMLGRLTSRRCADARRARVGQRKPSFGKGSHRPVALTSAW